MESACGTDAQAWAALNIVEREGVARIDALDTQDLADQRRLKPVIGLGCCINELALMEARVDAVFKLPKSVESVAGDALIQLCGRIGMAMISDFADT